MRVIAYGPDHLIEQTGPIASDTLVELVRSHPVTWIDVVGTGDEAMLRRLAEIFGLHRLELEDVVAQHHRAKVERYPDHLFIVARMVEVVDGELLTEQLTLVLGGRFVIMFQERPGDCFDSVRSRIREARGRIRQAGPDYLAYALVDAVVDHYFPIIESYGDRLDAFEDEILGRPRNDTLARLHSVQRDLLTLRRVARPMREAVGSLQRQEGGLICPETSTYLRDCLDHSIEIADMVDNYRETGLGLMDVYLSTMSNRLNEVMKLLTIIATIFIPLSFVASLYGMNFDTEASPFNMPELHWKLGYPFALGLMAAIAGGLLYYFRKKGWMGGGGQADDGAA